MCRIKKRLSLFPILRGRLLKALKKSSLRITIRFPILRGRLLKLDLQFFAEKPEEVSNP